MLIASDLPLQGGDADIMRGLEDAIRWVLKDHGFRAGRHVVGYQSCDESTAQTGDYEKRRCAANANAFARAEQVVAVIGPLLLVLRPTRRSRSSTAPRAARSHWSARPTPTRG